MKTEYLILNTRDELIRLDIATIAYLEAEGNYTHIVLQNGTKCIICMNLSRMQAIIDERLQHRAAIFARVGKRHIVNLDYVYLISIPTQRLFLSDGRRFAYQLPVSKEALKALRDLYVRSLGKSKPED